MDWQTSWRFAFSSIFFLMHRNENTESELGTYITNRPFVVHLKSRFSLFQLQTRTYVVPVFIWKRVAAIQTIWPISKALCHPTIPCQSIYSVLARWQTYHGKETLRCICWTASSIAQMKVIFSNLQKKLFGFFSFSEGLSNVQIGLGIQNFKKILSGCV